MIFWGIIAAIVMSLLIGWILADMFLKPIHELALGVKALHDRNPAVRIPQLNKDEFGDLGEAFNRTMEDVKELLYAQKIQTRLIPAQAPDVPGYQIELMNLAATDLGGDYCDVVMRKDGRALLVIGDVTGHGVSSALVMAMAKSGVFSYLQEQKPLANLMDRLNRLFCRLLKRKKLMTFFSALLDPLTGLMTYSNAGHPLPIHVNAAGEIQRLEMFHVPLGFSERGQGFEEKESHLEPGDVVVFYTDGFLEMRDAAGDIWGMPTLTRIIRDHCAESPARIRDVLVEAARQSLAGRPLDDDLTLVILKRL